MGKVSRKYRGGIQQIVARKGEMGGCCSAPPSRAEIYATALALAALQAQRDAQTAAELSAIAQPPSTATPARRPSTAQPSCDGHGDALPTRQPINPPPAGIFSRSRTPEIPAAPSAGFGQPILRGTATDAPEIKRPASGASTPRLGQSRLDEPNERTPSPADSSHASAVEGENASASGSTIPPVPRSPSNTNTKKSDPPIPTCKEDEAHRTKRRARQSERRRIRKRDQSGSHVVSVHVSSHTSAPIPFAQSVGIASPPALVQATSHPQSDLPLPAASTLAFIEPSLVPLTVPASVVSTNGKHGRRLSDALEGGLKAQKMLVALATEMGTTGAPVSSVPPPPPPTAPLQVIGVKTVEIKSEQATPAQQSAEGDTEVGEPRIGTRAPMLSYRRALSQSRLLSQEHSGGLAELKSSRTRQGVGLTSVGENTLNMPLEDGLRLQIFSPLDSHRGASTTRSASVESPFRTESSKFGSPRSVNNSYGSGSGTFTSRFGSVLKLIHSHDTPTAAGINSPAKMINSLMLATPTASSIAGLSPRGGAIRGSLGSASARLPPTSM
jgi:hypothetical protein